MRQPITWFSLIEVLIGILVVSIVMVGAFSTLTAVGIGKVKIIEKSSIEKESYFAAERLFELIKQGWTLDYEEYWNRTVINMTWAALYQSWHYAIPSWFWNFGYNWVYWTSTVGNFTYCMSTSGTSMWNEWCLTNFNISSDSTVQNRDIRGSQQFYGQYRSQFIDYNSDADNDLWNENNSTKVFENFLGDSDDLFLGSWPSAFTWSSTNSWSVQELYLINKNSNIRTFFRWNVDNDPYAPSSSICSWTQDMTWSWCLGTIEVLKLEWTDDGYRHGVHNGFLPGWYWDDDWEIDTWLIHSDFLTWSVIGDDRIYAWENTYSYWQPIFSDTIHVSNFEVLAFPNKDPEFSWRDTDPSLRVTPYVQVKITLQPSWKVKRQIKWDFPSTEIITTIQLSDLNFQ